MFYIVKIIVVLVVFLSLVNIDIAKASNNKKQSLFNILESVYQSNPALLAEYAKLNKAIEQIKEAKTGWRPDISVNANASSFLTEPGSFGTNAGEIANLGFSVTQPLYRGGRTIAKTHESELLFKAQEQQLLGIEQIVLLDTVSAYIDLVRDNQVVLLKEKNVANLKEQLEFEQVRHELGENTVTDLSQAKSRLAVAKAEFIQSKGLFLNTIAKYKRVVGVAPPKLDDIYLPAIKFKNKFPDLLMLETALQKGESDHPDIINARLQTQANKASQRNIKGELYPSLSIVGESQRTYRPTFAPSEVYQDQSRVSFQASIALYASGAVRSRLKQSRHDENRLQMELVDIRRNIEEGITIAWQNLEVVIAEMESRKAQVEATAIALEGTKAEFSLGGRTTLDILDAEEEKLDADVALVTVKHDMVLAKFTLFAATGQLTWKKISPLLLEMQ